MSEAKKLKLAVKLAVISPSTGPIISSLPVAAYPDVEFLVGNDLATFEVSGTRGNKKERETTFFFFQFYPLLFSPFSLGIGASVF